MRALTYACRINGNKMQYRRSSSTARPAICRQNVLDLVISRQDAVCRYPLRGGLGADMRADTADVVIVGAGIYGASVAFALASLGISQVLVLDERFPTAGASGRGDGILRIHYANVPEAQLAISSLDTYANWADIVGGSCGYEPNGFLWLSGHDDVDRLSRNVDLQRSLGGLTESCTAAEVKALQPHLDVSDLGSAAYEPRGGAGSAAEATYSLLAAAGRMGVKLCTWRPVRRLIRKKNQVTGVVTDRGNISCSVVVLTAGAWSAPLAATAGVDLPLSPVRCCTGRLHLPPSLMGSMTFIDTVSNLTFNPRSNGLAHLATRDDNHLSIVDPNNFVESVASSAGPRSVEALAERVPLCADAPLADSWAGVDGVTPDGKAILGSVTGVSGLVLGVGGNFKGFKIAPAVGTCLAQIVIVGGSSLTDISRFALSRFETTRPQAWSPTAYASSTLA